MNGVRTTIKQTSTRTYEFLEVIIAEVINARTQPLDIDE